MLATTTPRSARTALALALAALLAFPPATALAVPVGSPAEIERKQAEQQAAALELAAMREELDAEVEEYILLGREIEWTQNSVSEVQTQTVELARSLAGAKKALNERAVQMYKGESLGLFELMLNVRTPAEFITGAQYVLLSSERDAQLIDRVRRLHSESRWLQESLAYKLDRLAQLQKRSEEQRKALEKRVAAQQEKARKLGSDLAQLMRERPVVPVGDVRTGRFQPDTVISEANFRASTSMTSADIQAFLDRQPGVLKNYRGPDHEGRIVSAAEMIAEAAVAWGISPKVILTTLQKEQSLLAKANPTQRDLDWAMGCGKTDSRTYGGYRGFGKQVWWGAATLRKNADRWTPGIQLTIDGSPVRPTNNATYGQYRYTPHLHGVMSFWMLYWRYFGDPLA